ncbi:MAG: multidrug effflux MFS transporter [Acidimicrobiales bacterium]
MTGPRVSSDEAAAADTGIGRRELLILVSSVMALMALGIDLMLPAFDDIRVAYDLGAGSNETGQIVTVFFLGLAAAQLLYGPLADRFGRKPVLYLGIGISVVGAVGSALAPTFPLLLASRFVWGIGAAGARVVATAIIRDCFVGDAMARAMSQIMAVFVLVPVVAPTLGAGLIAIFPWQSVFWFCVLWSAVIAAWALRLRETLQPQNVRALSVVGSVRSYRQVAREPVTLGYTMATVFIQAVMTSYLAVSELIIGDIFDRKAQFPFFFGAVAASFGVAALVNGRLVERRGLDRMVNSAFALNIPLSILLVVVSVASDGPPNIWLFMAILAGVLSSFMLLMPNLNTAAMTPMGEIAGSAAAFTGALRIAGGAVLAAIATRWVSDSVVPFAVSVLVFCCAAAATVWVVRRQLEAKAVEPATSAVTG